MPDRDDGRHAAKLGRQCMVSGIQRDKTHLIPRSGNPDLPFDLAVRSNLGQSAKLKQGAIGQDFLSLVLLAHTPSALHLRELQIGGVSVPISENAKQDPEQMR